jgi:RimJ/RimL family protein N-acetyltransferase/adenylate kinase family enzyme
MFEFRELSPSDFELLHSWLNKDHVYPYYDGKITLENVKAKYQKNIDSDAVFPFIVYMEMKPIGFIQIYHAPQVGDGWWESEPEGTWGTDQFIGELKYMGKGIGSKFVQQFTDELLAKPHIKKIITDPAPNNPRAIRAYQKAGFRKLGEIDTPDGKAILMEKRRHKFDRIVIVGTSSSGKTTLAKNLSSTLEIPHKELDSFYWESNWTEADPEIFRERIQNFTQKEKWITDGNFFQVKDLVWGRATTVIWLDYPFLHIIKQFFTRSVRRSLSKEELWNGNTETFWNSIFSPNSLLMWILKSYRHNKVRIGTLLKSDEFPGTYFVRLKSPSETQEFLNKLGDKKATNLKPNFFIK